MADGMTERPACFVRAGDMPGFAWKADAVRVTNPFRFTPVAGPGTWEAMRITPAAVTAALTPVYAEEVYRLTQTEIASYSDEDQSRLLATAMEQMPVATAGTPALQRHGLPSRGGRRTVGRRRDALRLLGGPPPEPGPNPVIVFVVDTGIDKGWMNRVAPGRLFGTFADQTGPLESATALGTGLPRRHAHVTVRNVLAMAPRALIVDVPLLPATIVDFAAFLDRVHFAFRTIRAMAAFLRTVLPQCGIVVVNAWAVYDSERAGGVGARYLSDRSHAVNAEVIAATAERIDCVFAAGNTSRLVRDPRVGVYDGAPWRSIYGANALPEALCVTSVRTDGLWPGTASRGPEAPLAATTPAPTALAATEAPSLAARVAAALAALFGRAEAAVAVPPPPQPAPKPKPDVAAPSDFAEDEDDAALNLGTSAGCALGAGVVAAARSRNAALATPALFDLLRDTARPVAPQAGWNGRLGNGLIDVTRLFASL
jgi:hypothetical protein